MRDRDESDAFFDDFARQAGKMQKSMLRRFWWIIPLNVVLIGGFLVLVAVLLKWALSG